MTNELRTNISLDNYNTVSEMVEIYSELAKGSTVQVYSHLDDKWLDLPCHEGVLPYVNTRYAKYRVKPEPREFWVSVLEGTDLDTGTSYCSVIGSQRPQTAKGCTLIKVREVLE